MGCFDSVNVPCPRCGHVNVLQNKAGPCLLNTYSLWNAPLDILADLADTRELCEKCEGAYTFHVQLIIVACVTDEREDDDKG